MYDPVLVGILRSAPMVNTFLRYAYITWSLLDPNSKGINIFYQVLIITLIDFGVVNDPENYVYKVHYLFFHIVSIANIRVE